MQAQETVQDTSELQAVILCAGRSSRFWPLSEESHKSGLRLMGRPIIEYTIDSIERAGIKDIIIVEQEGSGLKGIIEKRWGMTIQFVTQKEPLGMGDALEEARTLIKERFFVLNPYHFNADKYITPMLKKSRDTGSDMILLGTPTDSPENYGIFDLIGDRAVGIKEKPSKQDAPSSVRVIGIYMLPKAFFTYHGSTERHQYSFEEALTKYMHEKPVFVTKTEEPAPTLKYPWDLLRFAGSLMGANMKHAIHRQPGESVTLKGRVHIGRNTTIHENAVIKGPVYIGNNCTIGNNAIIRDNTIIEDNVVIGANAEVTRSVIGANASIHSGFIGDSLIAPDVKIGAGIVTANRKIDRSEISSTVKGRKTRTGLNALGAIIGRGTRLGINASTMPGIMIGPDAVIGANTEVNENIDSKTIYYTEYKKKTIKRR